MRAFLNVCRGRFGDGAYCWSLVVSGLTAPRWRKKPRAPRVKKPRPSADRCANDRISNISNARCRTRAARGTPGSDFCIPSISGHSARSASIPTGDIARAVICYGAAEQRCRHATSPPSISRFAAGAVASPAVSRLHGRKPIRRGRCALSSLCAGGPTHHRAPDRAISQRLGRSSSSTTGRRRSDIAAKPSVGSPSGGDELRRPSATRSTRRFRKAPVHLIRDIVPVAGISRPSHHGGSSIGSGHRPEFIAYAGQCRPMRRAAGTRSWSGELFKMMTGVA